MRRVHVERLAGNAIGSLDDNFVIVEWTAEVGDHWIAPLHVHDEDDEAWYVLLGTLGFRLGGEEIPTYGYVAIAGGVMFSLLVGGGLMALVFYSNRHGYDDLSGGDNDRR